MAEQLARSRVHPQDVIRVGGTGLRTRPLRAALSALGVAIGIAAMVGVLGISESSKADLLAELDRLGTNLLTVTPGQTLTGTDAQLPAEAPDMIRRIETVDAVSATADVDDTDVFRTDYISSLETGGLGVTATDASLLRTLGGTMNKGTFLNASNERYPVTVLGYEAAKHLGVTDTSGKVSVLLGGHRFSVVGILDPLVLAPELDRSALIGFPAAKSVFGHDASPSRIYLRTDPSAVTDVQGLLGATANPAAPEEVQVSRPSDALAARAAAKSAFTALFLGLGSVALLVGGVGIANVMVISVLERRSEIGLRRALGATRGHIRSQFLAEALLLSSIGGVAGAALGAAATFVYASSQSWTPVIPLTGLLGGIGAALAIGAAAGLYPAMRAARLAPTEALRAV